MSFPPIGQCGGNGPGTERSRPRSAKAVRSSESISPIYKNPYPRNRGDPSIEELRLQALNTPNLGGAVRYGCAEMLVPRLSEIEMLKFRSSRCSTSRAWFRSHMPAATNELDWRQAA